MDLLPGNLLSGNGIGYRSVVFPFLHSRTKGKSIKKRAESVVGSCLGDSVFSLLPPLVKRSSSVYFVAGQPLDTWLPGHSLPLSHHFVVWLAAELVYPGVVTPFRNYAILGDDIVILDSLVAAKYRELLDDLGVQIEPMKSLSLELALLSLQNDYGSAEDKESHLFLSV
ncbi:hypothetical protein L1987_89567 [Smallanthus sonchifolius]|nr:hypothetical protein L1987_89567 [Smallanthus sonchifolius]